MNNDQQALSSTTPITRRIRELVPLAGAAAALAAVLIVWTIIPYGVVIRLHAPAFGSTQEPTVVSAGMALTVALLATLAGWGVVELLEAKARRPRRTWLVAASAGLIVSLSGPLSGHGISGDDRLALLCMHLAVGLALIPLFARSLPRRRKRGLGSDLLPERSAPTERVTP